jgi:predicted solute-binding protein
MTEWDGPAEQGGQGNGGLAIDAPVDLYAHPLVWGLNTVPGVRLRLGTVVEVAARFRAGESACALLPVLDAVTTPRARFVPGLGVCAPVEAVSERLVADCVPESIRRLSAGPSAGNAAAVARILLEELHGIQPEPAGPNPSVPADAWTLAGDAGLVRAGEHALNWDLGALWNERTGKPYVLALWVTGYRAPVPRLRVLLSRAAQQGAENLRQIAESAAESRGIPLKLARDYLEKTLQYRLGAEAADSVRILTERAARLGIAPTDAAIRFC